MQRKKLLTATATSPAPPPYPPFDTELRSQQDDETKRCRLPRLSDAQHAVPPALVQQADFLPTMLRGFVITKRSRRGP